MSDLAQLPEATPTKMRAGINDLAVVRIGDTVHALHAVVRHAGGPLPKGRVVDGCLECPWHGSRFRLTDGRQRRGPTVYDQPAYEIRPPRRRLRGAPAGRRAVDRPSTRRGIIGRCRPSRIRALVVLIGAAGAGKSTLAARLFAPDEIVSSDALRAVISGDEADQRVSAVGLPDPPSDRGPAAGRGRG